MSTRLYSRNAVLLAKIETTEGSDPTPDGANNAVLVSDLSITPLAGNTVDLAYVRPYFGASPSLRTSEYVEVQFTVDIAGTATAGTAPPWGPLLRACGFSQTLTAAAVTGTAAAGTTTSVTLAAGASSTDNIYVGATIGITSGTASGQSSIITAYNGTTKVATVGKAFSAAVGTGGYSIGANATYLPVSTGFDSVAMYFNQNGVRHKILGARGTVSFTLTANERPQMQFSFTGLQGGIADASEASPVYTSWKSPVAVNGTNTQSLLAGKLTNDTTSAASFQLQSFSLDMANSITYRQVIGLENVVLTGRAPAGNVSIDATTVTFKDWWADVRNITTNPFYINHGTASGNSFCLFQPAAQLVDPSYSDSDGITMLGMGIRALPSVGNDEVRIVVK